MSASPSAPEPAGPQETAGPVPLVLASRRPAGGRGRPPRHLADLPLAERRAVVAGLGQPPFRASQLSRHFFGRYTDRPEEMSDLPLAARDPLTQALLPRLLTPERELACDGGTTRKTLWRTFDGALVESVLMKYPDRVTMCVSSQAGCGLGCAFCETGRLGFVRNLDNSVLTIDGLWSLTFANNGTAGSSTTLYFTAGINNEQDGLFGTLTPVMAEQDGDEE